jgi:hypothetical protein
MQDLRRKERELADLEKALKKMSSSAPRPPEKLPVAKAVESPGNFPPVPDAESRQQLTALRKKIEGLKDEIRSQQGARQQLRRQLQEVNQRLSSQEAGGKEPAFPADAEDAEPTGPMPKKIQIPEYSAAFRKSCEHLPQPVVAKALLAAAGFAVRDEAVLRQTAGIELLPGYFRVRVGIHHRLLLRQLAGESLQIVDIIPRQSLETWIRQQAT